MDSIIESFFKKAARHQSMKALSHTKFQLFNGSFALALFDTGASHCFISKKFLAETVFTATHDGTYYQLITPTGSKILPSLKLSGTIAIGEFSFSCDCLVNDMEDVYIIVRMEWFLKYQASIFCVSREIAVTTDDRKRVLIPFER